MRVCSSMPVLFFVHLIIVVKKQQKWLNACESFRVRCKCPVTFWTPFCSLIGPQYVESGE